MRFVLQLNRPSWHSFTLPQQNTSAGFFDDEKTLENVDVFATVTAPDAGRGYFRQHDLRWK